MQVWCLTDEFVVVDCEGRRWIEWRVDVERRVKMEYE